MDPAGASACCTNSGSTAAAVQYAEYIGQVARGDLGTSLTTHEPVLNES